MNPYQASTVEESLAGTTEPIANQNSSGFVPDVIVRWGVRASWAYPIFLLGCFYTTWMVGWITLGRPPRPSLDDPSSIGWAVDIVYYFTGFVMVGFPAAALFGILFQLCDHRRAVRRRVGVAMGLIALWMVTIVFLRWDPLRVLDWFMD